MKLSLGEITVISGPLYFTYLGQEYEWNDETDKLIEKRDKEIDKLRKAVQDVETTFYEAIQPNLKG